VKKITLTYAANKWACGTSLSHDRPFIAQNVHDIVLHQTGEPQIQVVKKGTIQHIEDINKGI